MLRELTGGREAYVVVHVSDLYKLGLMRPDRHRCRLQGLPLEGRRCAWAKRDGEALADWTTTTPLIRCMDSRRITCAPTS